MSPGARSTEFLIAVVLLIFGATVVVVGLELGRDVVVVAALVQQAAVAVGYTASRAQTKSPPARLLGRGP